MADRSEHPIAALRERIYVPLPRDDMMRTHLAGVLKRDAAGAPTGAPARFTAGGETRGILVTGEPGAGKTELIRRALKRSCALRELGAVEVADAEASTTEIDKPARWVELTVSSPATVKSVGHELVQKLGYETLSSTAPAWRAWDVARHRIGVLGVSVVWIDEAHDLMNAKNPHETAATLRMFKSLMQGENAVVLMLSGIPALKNIIGQDQQLARRFLKLPLSGITAATDGQRLERALRGYCHRAGLVCEPEHDLLLRIIHAGRGQFGRCVELIIGAIETALDAGDRRLDQSHFAQRFAAQEGCDIVRNVFLSPRWSSLDLDAAA